MSKLETLLDAFAPPEGMVGHSAVLVAMTGEEDFLDELMQRFTRLRALQRSQLGLVTVYLMLDPHGTPARTGVFPPGRIPGLHELTPRSVDPASLLHAKLGLLAFSSSRAGSPARLRLVITTANFTYASAKQQLELVWTLDVPTGEASPTEDRADIASAAAFIDELIDQRFYRDEQSMPVKQRRLTTRLDALVDTIAKLKPSSSQPRFIHSLTTCLYDQIRASFEHNLDARRNLLLCGSGFYEEPSGKPKKPAIFSKLEALDIFTSTVERVALVEPGEAGAVALWAQAGNTDGWTIARPTDVLDRNRSLHAKFIYSGYRRHGHISNGWIYLGSGNLSRRGLLTTGAVPSGNIECGVVLRVPERIDVEDHLAHYLFWRPSAQEIKVDEWRVGRVGDAPDEDAAIIVPAPILSGSIAVESALALRLIWREDVLTEARVSISWPGIDWSPVPRSQVVFALDADKPVPVALRVRDDASGQEWTVPVVDASGRVSWQPPKYETFDDVLAALLDFPIRPADETSGDDEEIDGDGGGVRGGNGRVEDDASKTYALHAAAELLERTAALQRALDPGMLNDWFEHLDRTFRASFPEALVAAWRSHGINMFAHLRELEFRPQEMTDQQRAHYFDVLDRAAYAWGMP